MSILKFVMVKIFYSRWLFPCFLSLSISKSHGLPALQNKSYLNKKLIQPLAYSDSKNQVRFRRQDQRSGPRSMQTNENSYFGDLGRDSVENMWNSGANYRRRSSGSNNAILATDFGRNSKFGPVTVRKRGSLPKADKSTIWKMPDPTKFFLEKSLSGDDFDSENWLSRYDKREQQREQGDSEIGGQDKSSGDSQSSFQKKSFFHFTQPEKRSEFLSETSGPQRESRSGAQNLKRNRFYPLSFNSYGYGRGISKPRNLKQPPYINYSNINNKFFKKRRAGYGHMTKSGWWNKREIDSDDSDYNYDDFFNAANQAQKAHESNDFLEQDNDFFDKKAGAKSVKTEADKRNYLSEYLQSEYSK